MGCVQNLSEVPMNDSEPMYYVMRCEGDAPIQVLDETPDHDDAPWAHGGPVSFGVDEPLEYTLDSNRPGNLQPLYSGEEVPLIREDLLVALKAAGVDNLELFDAIVRDPVTGTEHTCYKAFNILGLVRVADLFASKLSDDGFLKVYEGPISDKAKSAQILLFRPAESVNLIIVADKVRKEVLHHKVPGMEFYDPKEEYLEDDDLFAD